MPGDKKQHRSAMRTCVAYESTRSRDRCMTLMDKQIKKSDRAIMWLHALCNPHKNAIYQWMYLWHAQTVKPRDDLCGLSWGFKSHCGKEIFLYLIIPFPPVIRMIDDQSNTFPSSFLEVNRRVRARVSLCFQYFLQLRKF